MTRAYQPLGGSQSYPFGIVAQRIFPERRIHSPVILLPKGGLAGHTDITLVAVAAAPVFADMAALAAWTGQFIGAHGTKFDTSGEFNQYLCSNP